MASRLHLLLITIDLRGGVGVFCRNLADGLKRYFDNELDIGLLLFRDLGRLDGDTQIFGPVRILGTDVPADYRRICLPPGHFLRLRTAIGELNPDVILTAGTYSNLLVPLAAGRPCVLTEHLPLSAHLARSRAGRLIGTMVRWRYPRYPVVVPSEGSADDLRQHFGVHSVRAIPHGLPLERIAELAKCAVHDLPPKPYLVACGRLSPEKDYPTLLEAYARARRSGLVEHLAIVGDGQMRAELEALGDRLGVTDRVHFLGHRDNPYPYLAGARGFVLSSRFEGFGLSLVEAMALGVPVIAADCPTGPGEILEGGKCGMLVPPGRPAELAEAMLRLVDSPDLRDQLRSAGRARAEGFALQRMAQRYRDLLIEVASRSPGSRRGER